jgi:hypothetical protein
MKFSIIAAFGLFLLDAKKIISYTSNYDDSVEEDTHYHPQKSTKKTKTYTRR